MRSADVTLPIDIDGEVVTVELAVEYEYTKGYPGDYGCPAGEADPPTPPEVDVRKATVHDWTAKWKPPTSTGWTTAIPQAAVDRRVAAGWPELERRLLEAAQKTFKE